jgi:hypothetical protein
MHSFRKKEQCQTVNAGRPAGKGFIVRPVSIQ